MIKNTIKIVFIYLFIYFRNHQAEFKIHWEMPTAKDGPGNLVKNEAERLRRSI